MMFNGDYRARRRKVELGGRSRDRDSVKGRQETVEAARKLREERQRRREEQYAAGKITAFCRGRSAAKRERARIRRQWIEENGELGEKLTNSTSTVGDVALALRQAVFFAGVNIDDAVRLSAACDAARQMLLGDWMRSSASTGIPELCVLAVSRCLFFLVRIHLLPHDQVGSLTWSREKVLFERFSLFISACLVTGPPEAEPKTVEENEGDQLGLENATRNLLSLLVPGGLMKHITSMIKISTSESLDKMHADMIGSLAYQLLKKCFQMQVHDVHLLGLLSVRQLWTNLQAIGTGDIEPMFWDALMHYMLSCPHGKWIDSVFEDGGHPIYLTVLENILEVSRGRLGEEETCYVPFSILLDHLFGKSIESIIDNLPGKPDSPSDMDCLPGEGQQGSIQTKLVENGEMWTKLCVSILPKSESEVLSSSRIDGCLALISTWSKLILACENSQPFTLTLTSLAFHVGFVERVWFFIQQRYMFSQPSSLSEADRKILGMALPVICSAHTIRLQIINDKEYYQMNQNLMDISRLNDVVIYCKNFVCKLVDEGLLTPEIVENEEIPWSATPWTDLPWADLTQVIFSQVVAYLDTLHEQNGRNHTIEEKSFHLNLIVDDTFIKALDKSSKARLFISRCPYVIPFHDRAKVFRHYLRNDREDCYNNLPAAIRANPFLSSHTAVIRRKYILEDGYHKLHRLGPELKRTVRIQFINELGEEEPGVDGGGLFKDFLESLLSTAFDTQYGFFYANSENKLYPHPSSSSASPDHLSYFRFFGAMVGKAMYEGILVDVPFAEFFLRKIRGKKNGFNDLPSLDKELHGNLCFLRGYKGSIEDLCLFFAIEKNDYGQVKVEELIPSGRDTPVTNANVIKYIHRMADYKLNRQLQSQISAFMQGFQEIINQEWLNLFNDRELQVCTKRRIVQQSSIFCLKLTLLSQSVGTDIWI